MIYLIASSVLSATNRKCSKLRDKMWQLVYKFVEMVSNIKHNVMMATQFLVMDAQVNVQSKLAGHASMAHLAVRVIAINLYLILLH